MNQPVIARCCAIEGRGRLRPASSFSSASLAPRPQRLVRLPRRQSIIGTDQPLLMHDGEGPARRVRLKSFSVDPYTVTNSWFEAFVSKTGYETDAERFGWSYVFQDFIDTPSKMLRASGSPWWLRVEGATWRTPFGPRSTLAGLVDHPVVHVSRRDAAAFATWAGGRLPSEAEWESAASGTLAAPKYPWGDRDPDDEAFLPCNIWQGLFPTKNAGRDGFLATAPAKSFLPNSVGLFNMCGNVWEWTADDDTSFASAGDVGRPEVRAIMKGGSYLCHRSYCWRYRIAARSMVEDETSTGHIGFRLVFDDIKA